MNKVWFVSLIALLAVSAFSLTSYAVDGWAVVEDLGLPGTIGAGDSNLQVIVTNRTDLATYAGKTEPYTIFVSGTLTGTSAVNVKSNKTIIGLGTDAVLDGFGLNMNTVSNIIIRNLTIRNSGVDAIALRTTHHVWIDHCYLSNCGDGLLDITITSNYVTVTNTHFYNHDKCCLVNSGTDQPADIGTLNCTFHHNWWDTTNQRNPRVGYGKVHVFNNLYNNNNSYCVGLHSGCRVLVQANVFRNTNEAIKQMYVTDPASPYYGFAEDVGNLYINTPVPNPANFGNVSFNPQDYYLYDFLLRPVSDVQAYVQANAGPKADAGVAPFLPLPGNGAINVSPEATLKWTTTPDVTVSSYNVYFGDTLSPAFQTNTAIRTFTPGSLQAGKIYYWRVDRVTPSGILTGPLWRFRVAGEITEDTVPPSPNPMTWKVEPYGVGSTAISMVASTAADVSGVEYYFANITDPTHDSGWQNEPAYTDTGLTPGLTYSYRVKARDKSANLNETDWSQEEAATTWLYECTAPIDNDFNSDCKVDLEDFAILASQWGAEAGEVGNLVVNGDFASGLSGWTITPNAPTTITWENGAALLARNDTTLASNGNYLYQIIPVIIGKQYKVDAQWKGDLLNGGTGRNWAEVFVGFGPNPATFAGSIVYKKATDGGPNATPMPWDWESILLSPNDVSSPADGIFTASNSYMTIAFNLGGRAGVGPGYFYVDNVSVVEVGGTPCPSVDLNDDCRLDLQDLEIFASDWLICGRTPLSQCGF